MIHMAAVSHGVGGPVHLVEAVVRQLAGLVTVPTQEGRQPHAPDLPQLREAEAEARVPGLVPEPVALPQVVELDPQQAGEGGAHDGARQPRLDQQPGEQVDVVGVPVDLLQLGPQLGRHLGQVREVGGPQEAAHLPVLVVAGQPVVTTSVDVESCEVETCEFLASDFKQMIGDLLRYLVVHLLHGRHDDAPHEAVQHPATLDQGRVMEDLAEWKLQPSPSFHVIFRHQGEVRMYHAVTKSEGRSRKFIEYDGRAPFVVIIVISKLLQIQ